jgi:PPOX class probable F420-dependent enzyme
MKLSPPEARARFIAARVAHLATVTPAGAPHVVPVTFAVHENQIAIAVDHKPKSTRALARLRNIEATPAVALLTDEYSDDWTQLWWSRADGTAEVLPDATTPINWLVAKYEQYQQIRPAGPVILTTVHTWTGWSASGSAGRSTVDFLASARRPPDSPRRWLRVALASGRSRTSSASRSSPAPDVGSCTLRAENTTTTATRSQTGGRSPSSIAPPREINKGCVGRRTRLAAR